MAKPDKTGVIIRADNGDVIGWDETGLTLHLSDRVIADIAARLDLPNASAAQAGADYVALDTDIDAWGAHWRGDWLHFTANLHGADAARGYMRHKDEAVIFADSHLPVMGIFALGGARAQLGQPLPTRFPYHLFAPADDIGAAGMGGEGEAVSTPSLLPLREMTHEALLAETLLALRKSAGAGLPLFVLRAETDMAASAADLGKGAAMANLEQAFQNHTIAAARLGRAAKVAAVCLDYCLEDISGDAAAYRDGILAVMAQITRTLGRLGAPRPIFLTGFDCGTQVVTAGAALDGQWELTWNHGDAPLICTGPTYAYAMDDTGRMTDTGRRTKAEISAQALLTAEQGVNWHSPRMQLAERVGTDIRLTCAAMEGLVIDAADPFDAGALAGFRLDGVTNKAQIKTVEVDPKDKRAVILRCTARPEGEVFVAYAHGAAPRKGAHDYPANAGALRDTWAMDGTHGLLHRWALPARLRLTDGGA
ncbi:MAG: hypothetical protein U5N55_05865 [Cypionkella sp.]|nr:hypothetical protein [Cypionkella sp.]